MRRNVIVVGNVPPPVFQSSARSLPELKKARLVYNFALTAAEWMLSNITTVCEQLDAVYEQLGYDAFTTLARGKFGLADTSKYEYSLRQLVPGGRANTARARQEIVGNMYLDHWKNKGNTLHALIIDVTVADNEKSPFLNKEAIYQLPRFYYMPDGTTRRMK